MKPGCEVLSTILPVLLLGFALSGCDGVEEQTSSQVTVEQTDKSDNKQQYFNVPEQPIFAATVSQPETGQVVVASYNIRNYLTMDRWLDGERVSDKPKPADEIAALIQVIKDIDADILQISEIGTREDLEDLSERLVKAGLNYSEMELLVAADEYRRLALFSRLPIVERNSQARLPYQIRGQQMFMQRGILDVTVEVNPNYHLRVIGVHLKSKRPVPEGQALMRRNEARLLRQHIDTIIEQDPAVNLLVTGDFNDTRNEPPIEEVMGSRSSDGYMADIWLDDPLGDRWTQYWRTADIYSRFDYVFVNRALFKEIDKESSYVYRSDYWWDASDHRPVVVIVNPVNL